MADKQVAFATSRALNAAAYAATKAVGKEMARVFDRPTSWVLKSVRYTKSDKRNLTATVDFDFGETSRASPWRMSCAPKSTEVSAKTSGMRSHCRKQEFFRQGWVLCLAMLQLWTRTET